MRVDDPVAAASGPPDLLRRRAPRSAGCAPCSPNCSTAAVVRWPAVPSARTVILAVDVDAGLEVAERLALLAAPLVTGAHADDATVVDEELRRRGLGQDHRRRPPRPARRGSGPAPTPRRSSSRGCIIVGGGGIRSAVRAWSAGTRPRRGTAPYVGICSIVSRPAKSSRIARGFIDRAGEEVRAGLLALLEERDRDVAEPLADLGCSSSSWPSRIAHARPPGPPPTIRTPTSIRSSGASVGAPIASALDERRRVIAAGRRLLRHRLRGPAGARSASARSASGRRRRRGRRSRRSARSGPC